MEEFEGCTHEWQLRSEDDRNQYYYCGCGATNVIVKPRSREQVVESLRESWMRYGADLLVDNNGRYDERKTFTGVELQKSILVELWIDECSENRKDFNDCLDFAGREVWNQIKREAFPDNEIYGA